MNNPFDKLKTMRDQLPPGEAPKPEEPKKEPPQFAEKVVVRFTRKGHGGKTVTVVTGVLPRAREALCTELKKSLGTGARVDGDEIVIQGDQVDRAVAFLEKKGARRVVRGT